MLGLNKFITPMKKFLFLAIGLFMFLAADAAVTYDVGQPQQSKNVMLLQQADAQPMVVDFICADYSVTTTIATAAETEFTCYEAMPIEVRTQVFEFTLPVFRLCVNKSNAFKSNLYTGWRGQYSNPPSQYDRA